MSMPPFDLTDPAQAGTYVVGANDLDVLAEGARRHGLLLRRIDFRDCHDKNALLRALAQSLDFPLDPGHSWDTLAASLADLSWLPARGYVLMLERSETLQLAAEDDFDAALDIMDDTSRRWAEQRKPFWTFLGLSEPEQPLPPDA
jgi:RNAse (barnase) inhibitor barstar